MTCISSYFLFHMIIYFKCCLYIYALNQYSFKKKNKNLGNNKLIIQQDRKILHETWEHPHVPKSLKNTSEYKCFNSYHTRATILYICHYISNEDNAELSYLYEGVSDFYKIVWQQTRL